MIYVNKTNNKTAKLLREDSGRVYFIIDGVEVSLTVKQWKEHYELEI